MGDDAPDRGELIEQAERVLEATKASMYYPVAHGEAARLQTMIEQHHDVASDTDTDESEDTQ